MDYCKKFEIAREFLRKYNWPSKLSNSGLDGCYCESCYPVELRQDTCIVGGNCYVVPRGWTRLGMQIDEDMAEQFNIWSDWSSSYYGTSIETAKSIIEHRRILMPEEQMIDDKEVFKGGSRLSGDPSFYTTPSIKYASLPQCTSSYKFQSPIDHERYKITVVLQCKQMPNSFTIQSPTVLPVSKAKRVCPFIPNEMLEWKSKLRSSVIVYGVLLRIEHLVTKVTIRETSCPHCGHSNVWGNPKQNQALCVTCSLENCQRKAQVFKCPHCDSLNTWKGNLNIKAAIVNCSNDQCLRWFQLVDCPHCYSLNVCKNAFYKIGRNNNVACSYEDCKEKFQQPLKQRRKSHGN